MKPVNILNKLNESSDWNALKDGLTHCRSAEDIAELMHSTLDGADYGEYCDYAEEIDGDYKVSDAKKDLRKIANDKIKSQGKYVLLSSMSVTDTANGERMGENKKINKLFNSVEEAIEYYLSHKDGIVGIAKADMTELRRIDHYGYDIKSLADIKKLKMN